MGTLLDSALGLMVPRGPLCTVALLKLQHPTRAAEIDELFAAVKDKRVQSSKAGQALREAFDVAFRDDLVRRHAKGVCQCRS